ncbi:MAG TPA: D-glycero-beta-D-manno-heptose 1-phosphate adenylyltransferase [Planctomycetaceae bacterium]|nr:D-glycero-beta-D-manno-heptose 1-phosphate adenylyltransferase [Planctomycetaceae bacterium]
MSYHLIDVMERLGHPRLLVVGDLILDRYVWGDAERISQEAPVILLREERQETRLGGAANVANMLKGLDVPVDLVGVVGADLDGRALSLDLQRAGIGCAHVTSDPSRPTTAKIRFMGRAQYRHPHQMLRVDRETRQPIPAGLAGQILRNLLPKLKDYSAVLISDYAKGVCTPEIVRPLIDACRALGLPVIVDPAAGGDYNLYRHASGVTPNRSETFKATGREIKSIDDAHAAGRMLVERFELDMAFVTIDRDGIVLAKQTGESVHLPTRPREVCDITGAGDMVLAMIGLGMAAGIDPVDLCKLANVAGGLEVEQIGVVPINRKEILGDLLHGARRAENKVCTLDELTRHVSARRKAGQKIVLTNGCFDLLHVGHVSYLQEAGREGDCLIVAINGDDSVRRLGKGDDRPIFDQQYRSQMLAGLEAVDYVVVFDEDTPHAVLEQIKPDVLVKGGTYRDEEIVGREVVLSYGGRVKPMGVTAGVSTTDIVRRLRAADESISMPITMPSAGPQRKAA